MVRMLDAAALLSAWEAAQAEPELRRPAVLLSAVWPEISAEEWAALPLGERDRCLIQLRDAWFGSGFETVATCPRCGERMDVTFRSADITAPPSATEPLYTLVDGRKVAFRLPSSDDLMEASRGGPETMRTRLLALCAPEAAALPEDAQTAVVQALALADPQADVQVTVSCPACGEKNAHSFDVASHLWDEIADWAARLFGEIHVLASTYGWSERDILAMSALRRRTYLQLAEG